jgi:hypothetical protein
MHAWCSTGLLWLGWDPFSHGNTCAGAQLTYNSRGSEQLGQFSVLGRPTQSTFEIVKNLRVKTD